MCDFYFFNETVPIILWLEIPLKLKQFIYNYVYGKAEPFLRMLFELNLSVT